MAASGTSNRFRIPTLAYVAIATALAVIIAVAWALMRTAPPSTVVMATGPEGSAYRELGLRYQEVLARDGVTLRLEASEGGVDNLQRLNDANSAVSVAFVQSGLTSAKASPELASLGTVFYEPVWVFYRGEPIRLGAGALKGRRMSVGPPGSGIRKLSLGGNRFGRGRTTRARPT